MNPSHALYFHIPFCAHRCAYCDFNTYAGQESLIPTYMQALIKEVEAVAATLEEKLPIHTVFFGGGTPSLVPSPQLDSVLRKVEERYQLSPLAEISLEANPGTVSADYLQALKTSGFNRLSFGVQSANPFELTMLEREHSFGDVIQSVLWARQAGFENINLDLIYGLPEQSMESWQNSVKRIVDLNPEHLSMYALTLEHGTPFGRWAQKGLLPIPNPDLAAEMYAWADAFARAAGYEQYEISNWAKPGKACQHNLQYWRNLPYLGLGAGAHGYAGGNRYSNVLRIKTYIERCLEGDALMKRKFPLSPATVNQHLNDAREDMQETMLTSLRLTAEGLSDERFNQQFGIRLNQAFGKEIKKLQALGLLEWQAESLRLTPRARMLSNRVFIEFVGD